MQHSLSNGGKTSKDHAAQSVQWRENLKRSCSTVCPVEGKPQKIMQHSLSSGGKTSKDHAAQSAKWRENLKRSCCTVRHNVQVPKQNKCNINRHLNTGKICGPTSDKRAFYDNSCLWCMSKPPFSAIFTEGNNFCCFLSVSLDDTGISLDKQKLLLWEKIR